MKKSGNKKGKIPSRYTAGLNKKDKEKQIQSIRKGTIRPKLKRSERVLGSNELYHSFCCINNYSCVCS